MADNFNTMQAQMGLQPGGSPIPNMRTPSPAETALMMSNQAAQQLSLAAQSGGPAGRIAAFGQQFQQQLGQIQQAQSLNPYVAQMLERSMQQGGATGMLPSPLTMTPPETGIFRPPTPSATFAPIPPMPTMPQFPTPFTPQMPQPQFRTAWEQESMQREQRGDQLYSQIMQAPRVAGTAAGMGIGALMGAGVGRRFGPAGAMVGAVGGAALAGMSGAAQGMGSMAMMPMQPQIEARSMGAALQRTSQNWVIGGPDIHPLGRGLSREGGQGLAQGIQQMAGSQEFKSQTGGMFNREDLMKITGLAGQTGLMDMEQSIPQIKTQLQRVSRTVSAFMQLTNDPNVTNVIRQMGQLRGMGMSMPEIESAAYQMKAYARAAGTSIGGIQAQGGLPGAATFQQAGLSPAAGFGYGMHAVSSARQAVASGTFSPMQLAMQGGVQGVAQRDMQAQAAYMGTPMFAAAAGSFQGGRWQMDPSKLAGQYSQGGGAQGLALGAIGSLGQAVQQGGMGALANFGLMQKEISSTAAQVMTPGEMNLMRFRGAMQTGKMLGMQGADALSVGGQAMYGQDITRQMMLQAANPEYWREQQRGAERSLNELGGQQYADIKSRAPGVWDKLKATRAGRAVRGAGEAIASPFQGMAGIVGDAAEGISNWRADLEAQESGEIITRRERGTDITDKAAADYLAKNYQAIAEGAPGEGTKVGVGSGNVKGSELTSRQIAAAGKATGTIGDVPLLAQWALDVGSVVPIPYTKEMAEWGVGELMRSSGGATATEGLGSAVNLVNRAQKERAQVIKMSAEARTRKKSTIEERLSVLGKIGKKSSRSGDPTDIGVMIKQSAAQAISSLVLSKGGLTSNDRVTSDDRRNAVLGVLSTYGIKKGDIPADLLDTFVTDSTNSAEATTGNPAQFADVMTDTYTESVQELADVGKSTRESRLAVDKSNREGMETYLGLQKDKFFGLYSEEIEGAEDLRVLMQHTDKLDIQTMVALGAGEEALETQRKRYEKSGRKESWGVHVEQIQEKMSKDISAPVRKALGAMSKRGAKGVIGAGIMTGQTQRIALSGALPGAVSDLMGDAVGAGFEGKLGEVGGVLGAGDILEALKSEGSGRGGIEGILAKLDKGGKSQKAVGAALREFSETGSVGAGEDLMKVITGTLTAEEILKQESAYAASGPEADRLKKGKAAARAGEEEFGDIVVTKFGPAAKNLLDATIQFAKANEERAAVDNLKE